ncbi:hypothetical protein J3F83DRAFT_121633 [Trichoderma novae-zelandiae]
MRALCSTLHVALALAISRGIGISVRSTGVLKRASLLSSNPHSLPGITLLQQVQKGKGCAVTCHLNHHKRQVGGSAGQKRMEQDSHEIKKKATCPATKRAWHPHNIPTVRRLQRPSTGRLSTLNMAPAFLAWYTVRFPRGPAVCRHWLAIGQPENSPIATQAHRRMSFSQARRAYSIVRERCMGG